MEARDEGETAVEIHARVLMTCGRAAINRGHAVAGHAGVGERQSASEALMSATTAALAASVTFSSLRRAT
jgi:hypothetical protein